MTTMTASEKLGYEERRPELEAFVDQNYIGAFDLKPGRLLDVGCGDGFWADIFERRGFTVVGVDRDPDAITVARARRELQEMNDGPVYMLLDFDDPEQLAAIAHGVHTAGAPDVIFARTLPHFYQPTLEPAATLVEQLLTTIARRRTLLLLSIYSDETGRTDTGVTHHALADLLAMVIDAGGAISGAHTAAGYVQIGACRR